MAPQLHLGILKKRHAAVLRSGVSCKALFNNHHLIRHLHEVGDEIAVGRSDVNLITQFGKRSPGDVRQADRQRPEGSFGSFRTAVGHDTSTLVPSNRSRHLFRLSSANLPGRSALSGAHYRDLPAGKQIYKRFRWYLTDP